MNPTSLANWFPKVASIGIPVPRTTIIPVDRGAILHAMDGAELPSAFVETLRKAGDDMRFPLFLRTDLSSGKHGWKDTCFVPSRDDLIGHMMHVCEENEMAQIIGLDYTAIVLREFLSLHIGFHAFWGNMPINKERRYFVSDGRVLCHHPYWPEEAIEGYTEEPDWKRRLAILNIEDGKEIARLSDYALRVNYVLPGCWSVDFAKTAFGNWYLIDMAVGKNSYHWKGCPNEGLLEERSFLDLEPAGRDE